jgi:copper chaperone
MFNQPKIQRICDMAVLARHIAMKLYLSHYTRCYRASVAPKTERAFLKIVGVYCTSCKPTVEKRLREEKAIKNIIIEFMSVSVYFDPSLTQRRTKE